MRPGIVLEPAPIARNWFDGMPDDLGMFKNDVLGDCTCADEYHMIQTLTFNATGKMQTEPDSNVELMYELACGYDPKQGGEGQGGVMQDVLTFLLNTGAPVGPDGTGRHKLAAFFEIDPRRQMDIQYAINACGGVKIGMNMPRFIMEEMPDIWDVRNGDDGGIVGGHDVFHGGYDWDITNFITWGGKKKMTWEFFAKYVDEAYAPVDPDWITAKGMSPVGLTLGDWEAQMRALKQG